MTTIPTITHLQFLILESLQSNGAMSANDLRRCLNAHGDDRAGPKFYQLMNRMEASGFLTSESRTFGVAGGTVSRTYYRAVAKGRSAILEVQAFYQGMV